MTQTNEGEGTGIASSVSDQGPFIPSGAGELRTEVGVPWLNGTGCSSRAVPRTSVAVSRQRQTI